MTFHRYDPRCPIASVIKQTDRALDSLAEEIAQTPRPTYQDGANADSSDPATDKEWEAGYWEEQIAKWEEREALAFL